MTANDRCYVCMDRIPGARFDPDYRNDCMLGAKVVIDCNRAMSQARFSAAVIKNRQAMISAALAGK